MISKDRLLEIETELCKLMQAKLGVKAEALQPALRKAGRRLPKRLQRRGALISDALARADHPQLAIQANQKAIEASHGALKAYLGRIDPAEAKLRARLRLAGDIAFKLLFVAALFIVVLKIRGFV